MAYDAANREIRVGDVVARGDRRGIVEGMHASPETGASPMDKNLSVAWAERGGCWVEPSVPADTVRRIGRASRAIRCEGETPERYGSWGNRWQPPKVAEAVWRQSRMRREAADRRQAAVGQLPTRRNVDDTGLRQLLDRLREDD